MTVFESFNINASGLALERLKLDTISSNIANVNTTRTAEGGAYRKKTVVFEESLKTIQDQKNYQTQIKSQGVRVTGLLTDDQNVEFTYNPNHPDADADGYVEQADVNMADEMIELMNTVRTYEANISAFESSKNLMKKALEISKD